MKTITIVLLAYICVCLTGCGKPPNVVVTDGVDVEKIRAYEAAVAASQAQDTVPISRQQAIAEEKEAAELLKKMSEEAKTATP